MFLFRLIFILLLSFTLGLASIGKISLAKGDVSINRDSKTISVKSGTDVFKKDIISTFKKSKAQIRFVDNTVISIGNDSSFKVDEYFNDLKKPKAKFSFLKGTFKSITGKIGKIAPQNFNLQTKTAAIGIRGTIVVGNLLLEADKIGCVQGAIEVQSLSGGQSVFLDAGLMTVIKKGEEPSKPVKMNTSDLEDFGLIPQTKKSPTFKGAMDNEGQNAIEKSLDGRKVDKLNVDNYDYPAP